MMVNSTTAVPKTAVPCSQKEILPNLIQEPLPISLFKEALPYEIAATMAVIKDTMTSK